MDKIKRWEKSVNYCLLACPYFNKRDGNFFCSLNRKYEKILYPFGIPMTTKRCRKTSKEGIK